LKIISKEIRWFLLGFALLLALGVFYAPSFLIIFEAPVKSDAVVLFLGGQKGIREKEAYLLVKEGYADYLIIPNYGQIRKRGPDGKLAKIDAGLRPRSQNDPNQSNHPNKRNWFAEDTHIELIETKRIMDASGLHSALFVSSPYHMRRIKLIAEKVLGDTQVLHYVPTRYETYGEDLWLISSREWKHILTEYAKIAWFLVYSPFV